MFRASALRQGIDYKILLSQFLKVFRNLQGFLYKEKEKKHLIRVGRGKNN